MGRSTARGPIEVTVEIPSGSRNKYEYDHLRHRFVLDRTLYSSVHYPCDYGFIEGSLADDEGHDFKIMAVASDDPRWDAVAALDDLSPHRLIEIENFFKTYKTLERR